MDKAKERISRFLAVKWKGEEQEKKGRKSKQRRTRQVLGKTGRMLLFLMLVARNWLCVNAAPEGLQQRTEMMERWQNQEVQVKESRWTEEIPQRWKQPKGED